MLHYRDLVISPPIQLSFSVRLQIFLFWLNLWVNLKLTVIHVSPLCGSGQDFRTDPQWSLSEYKSQFSFHWYIYGHLREKHHKLTCLQCPRYKCHLLDVRPWVSTKPGNFVCSLHTVVLLFFKCEVQSEFQQIKYAVKEKQKSIPTLGVSNPELCTSKYKSYHTWSLTSENV